MNILRNTANRAPKRQTMLLAAGLALSLASCAETYEGGGVVASTCIPQEIDLHMQEGDKVYVGVGDLSVKSDIQDALTMKVLDGRVQIDYPDTNSGFGERAVVGEDGNTSLSVSGIEENGVRMIVSIEPTDSGIQDVHLEKICPKE